MQRVLQCHCGTQPMHTSQGIVIATQIQRPVDEQLTKIDMAWSLAVLNGLVGVQIRNTREPHIAQCSKFTAVPGWRA